MNGAMIPGSLQAIAQRNGTSLAESFVSCDVIIVVDTSGSMSTPDSRGGKSRYDVACEELAALQANLPGKIAVIAFSHQVQFCPGGIAVYLGGGTAMHQALSFVKIADLPGMRFILISDGEPDDGPLTLEIARTFQNKIETVYVGPEERPTGRDFLQKLAAATGGVSLTVDRAKELKINIEHLLLHA